MREILIQFKGELDSDRDRKLQAMRGTSVKTVQAHSCAERKEALKLQQDNLVLALENAEKLVSSLSISSLAQKAHALCKSLTEVCRRTGRSCQVIMVR